MTLPLSGNTITFQDVSLEANLAPDYSMAMSWMSENSKAYPVQLQNIDMGSLYGLTYYQKNNAGACNNGNCTTNCNCGNIQCNNCVITGPVNCVNCDAQPYIQTNCNCESVTTYNCAQGATTYNCNCACDCACACDCPPPDCACACDCACPPPDCACACDCACDCNCGG